MVRERRVAAARGAVSYEFHDRGLDAQPVPAPDRGLDGLVVRGWSVEQETPVLHAVEAATSARAAANRQQVLEDGDYEAGYATSR
jgi:hypothetical protein